jgi:antitoxin PrlF
MPTATLTSKGQITIPAKIRAALGLQAGDKIDFVETGAGQFAIRPRTASIRDLEGCIAKLGYVPSLEEMDEAVARAAAENYLSSLSGTATPANPSVKPRDEAA